MQCRALGGAEFTRILIRATWLSPGPSAGWARRGSGRRILEDSVRQPVQEHPSEKRVRGPAGLHTAPCRVCLGGSATGGGTCRRRTDSSLDYPFLGTDAKHPQRRRRERCGSDVSAPSASAITGPHTPGVSGHTAFDGGSSANQALASRVRNAPVVVRGEISGIGPLATLRLHRVGAISEAGSTLAEQRRLAFGFVAESWTGEIGAAPLRPEKEMPSPR